MSRPPVPPGARLSPDVEMARIVVEGARPGAPRMDVCRVGDRVVQTSALETFPLGPAGADKAYRMDVIRRQEKFRQARVTLDQVAGDRADAVAEIVGERWDHVARMPLDERKSFFEAVLRRLDAAPIACDDERDEVPDA